MVALTTRLGRMPELASWVILTSCESLGKEDGGGRDDGETVVWRGFYRSKPPSAATSLPSSWKSAATFPSNSMETT
ncbi:hypothetical protein M5689_014217 [Euphorbia peplus]|nr:hypothetical protein M5689_014217 [Euphorbia peplus]